MNRFRTLLWTIAKACWALRPALPGSWLHLQEERRSRQRQRGNLLTPTPCFHDFRGSPHRSAERREDGFLNNPPTSIADHWQPVVNEGHWVCELGPASQSSHPSGLRGWRTIHHPASPILPSLTMMLSSQSQHGLPMMGPLHFNW